MAKNIRINQGGNGMMGLGYKPVCSSSSQSKTQILSFYGTTALFFRENHSVF